MGRREVSTYPSSARCHSCDGRLGDVRHAADIPAGIAGSTGEFTASALDADMPALSRTCAIVAQGRHLDFPRFVLDGRRQGVTIPLRVNRMGRYFVISVDFGQDASRKVRGPVVSVSYFEGAELV